MKIALLAVIVASVTLLAPDPGSTRAAGRSAPSATVTLAIQGPAQTYTLAAILASRYAALTPAVSFVVTPPSPRANGVTAACTGSLGAIGITPLYIQDAELVQPGCTDLVEIPIAVTASPVAYNLPGAYFTRRAADGVTPLHPVRLTPAALVGIYLGSITHWNDPVLTRLNPGAPLPAAAIRPFHSLDDGWADRLFSLWLAGASPRWAAALAAAPGQAWPAGPAIDATPTGRIAQPYPVSVVPYSIADVAYDLALSSRYRLAALQNTSGAFVVPSTRALSAAVAGGLRDGMPRDFRRLFVAASGRDAFDPSYFVFMVVHRTLLAAGMSVPSGQAEKTFLRWVVDPRGGQRVLATTRHADGYACIVCDGASEPTSPLAQTIAATVASLDS